MTKTELKEKLRYILNNVGSKKIDRSCVYFPLLLDTISKHPKSEDKIGVGIDYFYVQKSKWKRGQFNYMIKRKDGTDTDFSYLKCLNNNHGKSNEWTNRFREIVNDQIISYKESKVKDDFFTCEVSGNKLRENKAHIDHYGKYKFIDIFNNFIKDYNIDLQKVSIDNENTNGSIRIITDEKIRTYFYDYHMRLAKLRIVEDKINCSLK